MSATAQSGFDRNEQVSIWRTLWISDMGLSAFLTRHMRILTSSRSSRGPYLLLLIVSTGYKKVRDHRRPHDPYVAARDWDLDIAAAFPEFIGRRVVKADCRDTR